MTSGSFVCSSGGYAVPLSLLDSLTPDDCHTALWARREQLRDRLRELPVGSPEYRSLLATIQFLVWRRLDIT